MRLLTEWDIERVNHGRKHSEKVAAVWDSLIAEDEEFVHEDADMVAE
jgi:hypothetical protein